MMTGGKGQRGFEDLECYQHGYIRYLRKQQQGSKEYGHHALHEERTIYLAIIPDNLFPDD